MHVPIIQLSTEPIQREDWHDSFYYCEDISLPYVDYINDDGYTDKERKGFIRELLPKYFSGLATVDADKETITVLDCATIKETIKEDFKRALSEIMEKYPSVVDYPYYLFRMAGYWFRGQEFYVNEFTSAQFVESLCCYSGQTLYIGSILDAHI